MGNNPPVVFRIKALWRLHCCALLVLCWGGAGPRTIAPSRAAIIEQLRDCMSCGLFAPTEVVKLIEGEHQLLPLWGILVYVVQRIHEFHKLWADLILELVHATLKRFDGCRICRFCLNLFAR